MDSRLKLDPTSPTPIFQQIIDGFEGLIITGALQEKAALPSVRELAVLHSVNPNTVSKAYQLLQSMSLIEPVRGLGLRVSKIDAKLSKKRRSEILDTEVDRLISVAKTLQSTPLELTRLIQERWRGTL